MIRFFVLRRNRTDPIAVGRKSRRRNFVFSRDRSGIRHNSSTERVPQRVGTEAFTRFDLRRIHVSPGTRAVRLMGESANAPCPRGFRQTDDNWRKGENRFVVDPGPPVLVDDEAIGGYCVYGLCVCVCVYIFFFFSLHTRRAFVITCASGARGL